ncbi:MAG: glycyl-radical enzyme activating protein [Dehalobacterium sp.]
MSCKEKKIMGNVFNVQKFSVHDGPGIRDVIFMKGCPLRCKWCCNPESQNAFIEIGYIKNKCIGINECGYCIEACPTGAIYKSSIDSNLVDIDRQLCTNCGKCADACPAKAITLFGKLMSVDEVIDEIQKDNTAWRSSGGITISGGELLQQAEFVQGLLRECQKRGIDTAIETSGFGKWEDLEKICRHSNLVFYDIKSMNSDKHKLYTGVNKELIIKNLVNMCQNSPDTPVIVRTPLIPGFNDSGEDIEAIINFIAPLNNVKEYEIMPYHAFGEAKYRELGREYELDDISLSKEHAAKLSQKAKMFLKEKRP